MGHHIYSLNTFAWTSFDGVHWKTHFFSRFFTKHVVLYRSFSSQTHSSTPPFSSCFKISEKAEQQKTKHNIQLKTARSVKMLNSARQLIHLQFHWDHRDCGNAAFRNFSHVTKQRFSIHHFSSYSLSLFIRREGNPGARIARTFLLSLHDVFTRQVGLG